MQVVFSGAGDFVVKLTDFLLGFLPVVGKLGLLGGLALLGRQQVFVFSKNAKGFGRFSVAERERHGHTPVTTGGRL